MRVCVELLYKILYKTTCNNLVRATESKFKLFKLFVNFPANDDVNENKTNVLDLFKSLSASVALI